MSIHIDDLRSAAQNGFPVCDLAADEIEELEKEIDLLLDSKAQLRTELHKAQERVKELEAERDELAQSESSANVRCHELEANRDALLVKARDDALDECARLCNDLADWPIEKHANTNTGPDHSAYEVGIRRGLIIATNNIRDLQKPIAPPSTSASEGEKG